VLRVPNKALRYIPTGTAIQDSDQPRVWVLRDGSPAPVQVATGLDDDKYTEIIHGDLKAGDKVIVAERANSAGAGSTAPRPRL
jgi:HlyD family secretion protein